MKVSFYPLVFLIMLIPALVTEQLLVKEPELRNTSLLYALTYSNRLPLRSKRSFGAPAISRA